MLTEGRLMTHGPETRKVLELVRATGFPDDALWFNGTIETLGRTGVRRLREADAVVQCPIDFLVPLLVAAPASAEDVLAMLADWGIDPVSLDWRTPGGREVLDVIEELGWEINLYGVPDPRRSSRRRSCSRPR
jgi:hypothetical protein